MPGSFPRRKRIVLCGALVTLSVVGALVPPAAAQQSERSRDDEVTLEQNFPNPFTPGVSPTIFTFTIPDESHVRLAVYNLLAQEVAVLVDERKSRGRHRVAWDGIDGQGRPVAAGVYWYRLEVGERRPLLKRLRVREAATTENPGLATKRG